MAQNTVKLSCSRCGKPVKNGKKRQRGSKYVCVKCRRSDFRKMRHGGHDATLWDARAARAMAGL